MGGVAFSSPSSPPGPFCSFCLPFCWGWPPWTAPRTTGWVSLVSPHSVLGKQLTPCNGLSWLCCENSGSPPFWISWQEGDSHSPCCKLAWAASVPCLSANLRGRMSDLSKGIPWTPFTRLGVRRGNLLPSPMVVMWVSQHASPKGLSALSPCCMSDLPAVS